MSLPVLIVYAGTVNDRNGNPRRLFLAYDSDARLLGVEDEGHDGTARVRMRWPGVPITAKLNVTPKEYHALKRIGAALAKKEAA